MEITQVERAAVAAVAVPNFADVGCSRCLQKFGPGDSGFSTCSEHAHLDGVENRLIPAYHYVSFHSKFLGVDVRVGMEFEGEEFSYQHCTIQAGWEIRDVWIGGAELSQFMRDDVLPYIETEAIAAVAVRS